MRFLIKVLCCWIPKSEWRKAVRNKLYNAYLTLLSMILSTDFKLLLADRQKLKLHFSVKDFENIQRKYPKILEKLKSKVKNGEKIRVGFIVHLLSAWSTESLLLKMMNNPLYEVSIIVTPTHIREFDKEIEIYQDCLDRIKAKYENKIKIYEGYNESKNKIVDTINNFDIVFLASNDENIEFNGYKIYNIIKKDVLTCYVSYAYSVARDDSVFSDTYNMCWKIFTENKLNFEDLEEREPIKGYNAVITGYSKADAFSKIEKNFHERKQIIIAPHHSIHGYGLQGQFLKFYDLFLELPQMYPQIDFIFRPHPLLYNTLIQPQYWGEEKTKEYYQKMDSYKNCIYDTKPYYYQTFVNSDGIIHDCGSFLPEYLYTGNPACYTLKSKDVINKYFGTFGNRCLACYYRAYKREDILTYIENVVLNGNDVLKEKRQKFCNDFVKWNYPYASDAIINCLNGELANGK